MTDLRRSWDEEADRWVAFARTPGHDIFFWGMGLQLLLELLPPPGQLTVDLGCGEGRIPRELRSRGYHVVGIDGSATMLRHAVEADPGPYLQADAAYLPLRDGCADLAIAYMTLHDFDDLDAAVSEVARTLRAGGRFCFAIVHPMNSARDLDATAADAPLIMRRSYLEPFRYRFDTDRGGIPFTFHSMHRPLEAYTGALERAGLLIETLREPVISEEVAAVREYAPFHRRFPIYLFGRAVKP